MQRLKEKEMGEDRSDFTEATGGGVRPGISWRKKHTVQAAQGAEEMPHTPSAHPVLPDKHKFVFQDISPRNTTENYYSYCQRQSVDAQGTLGLQKI